MLEIRDSDWLCDKAASITTCNDLLLDKEMQIAQSKHPEMLCENACIKRCKREDLLHYLRATAKN